MGQINDINTQLQERLVAEIEGIAMLSRSMCQVDGLVVTVPLQVKCYPKRRTENDLRTLANAGAVLTRYAGSTYGQSRAGKGWFVQDRELSFEVICVSNCLLDEDAAKGIYEILDIASDRLIGHVPAGAVGPVSLIRDDYLSELDGSWEYGIIVSVPVQKRGAS